MSQGKQLVQAKTSGNRATSVRVIQRHQRRALWAPIIVLEAYLAATIIIFFFGPVDWFVPSPAKLGLFLLLNYGALWLGYKWGIKRARIELKGSSAKRHGQINVPRPIILLIVWSMVLTITFTIVRLLAIRGGIGEVIATLQNPGEAYKQAQEIAQMDRDRVGMLGRTSSYGFAFRISTLLSVFNGLYFPLGLACWRRLLLPHRVFFVISVLFTVSFAMGVGAQSGIGFMVFSALPVALYRMYVSGKPLSTGYTLTQKSATRKVAQLWVRILVLVSLCVLVATVVFFQVDRQEATGRRAELQEGLVGNFGLLSGRSILPFASERFNFGLLMLSFYVSHGYEGLALSMELPFEPTYGLGWSKALQVIYHDYIGGPDVFPLTYLSRNEEETGWPALLWWSTIFPWIASDTTYFGTWVFMLIVGFVTARCWGEAVISGNPVSFAVLAQMFTLVFMFPANNALAQTLDGLFALVGVCVLYGLSRKVFRKNRGIRVEMFRSRVDDLSPVNAVSIG